MCLAVPGKIISIDAVDDIMRLGKVDFNGILREVNLSYVPEARAGEFVIVHAGFALNVIDEKEAEQVFEYLNDIYRDDLNEGQA